MKSYILMSILRLITENETASVSKLKVKTKGSKRPYKTRSNLLNKHFPLFSVPTVRLYPPFLCYSLSTKPQFLTHELSNFHHIFETNIRLMRKLNRMPLDSKDRHVNDTEIITLVFLLNAYSIRSKVSIRANPKENSRTTQHDSKFGPRQTHSVSENAISSSCTVQFRPFILSSRVIVSIYRFKRDNFLSENVIFESKIFLPNAQHSKSFLDVRLVEKLGHLPPDK